MNVIVTGQNFLDELADGAASLMSSLLERLFGLNVHNTVLGPFVGGLWRRASTAC